MAGVGDRIAVASKGVPRSGVVTSVSGAMITVRWDGGGESSLVPGPGVLSVVSSRRRSSSAPTRPKTSGATGVARKTGGAGSRRSVAKKVAPGGKAVGKTVVAGKPPAKKAVPSRKAVTKGTSSRPTTGKKPR